MATWLTHLRIADRLFDEIKINDKTLFFAGNIAPDINISPDITHWCINGDKATCDVNSFYHEYIQYNTSSSDFDFYLGYYVHLLTDILWHKQMIEPLKRHDRDFIRNVKENWNSIDYNFLSDEKVFRPIVALSDTVKYEKQWFDYCSAGQIKELYNYIITFRKDNSCKCSCVDITIKQEIELFIEEASNFIFSILKQETAE